MTRSKVADFGEVVAALAPGTHIHFALTGSRPNAAIRELLRRHAGTGEKFTVSATGLGGPHLGLFLVTAGMVDRVVCGFIGDQYPSPGPNRRAVAAIAAGELIVEPWSLLSLLQRLRAGAQGLEWTTTGSLRGSSLIEDNPDILTIDGVTLVRALRPDVTFLHGIVADEDGNTLLPVPVGEALLGAAAAVGGAVVTVEEVVPASEIRAHAGWPVLPGSLVSAVCPVRFGAHPSGVFTPPSLERLSYGDDYDFIAETTRVLGSSDAELDAWVASRLIPGPDVAGDLDALGPERRSYLSDWRSWGTHSGEHPVEPTPGEELAIHAARWVSSAVNEEPPDQILTGIGLSSLATWVARDGDDRFPPMVSEVGIYDYQPVPGDPFLFYFPNLEQTRVFTDTDTILGTLIQGHGDRSMAVLSAAQVDRFGNVNTTRTGRGWITGSGGANDIASGCRRIIVLIPLRRHRLVADVDYVTSPGDGVEAVVTDRAVFRRHGGGELVLAAVAPRPGETLEQAIEGVTALVPWPLALAERVEVLPAPTTEELIRLRAFDPHRFFLGSGA